ncbi:MAG: AEC family transporter [Clostridia bacterium]|nr:AEC family transporter [Clostridia bacterium]
MKGEILIPVLLSVGSGYLAGRHLRLDTRPISQLSIYVLMPALVLAFLQKASLGWQDYGLIALFTLLLTLVMDLVSGFLAKFLGAGSAERSALQLSAVFMNSSNYGLPVVLLAFGQAGAERAVVFIVLQLILLNSLAVFYAARARQSVRESLLNILKMPTIWAIVLAFLLRLFQVELPGRVWFTLNMMGQASIPVMLLTLGIQLSSTKLAGELPLIGVASGLRLLLSPLVAVALIYLLGDPRGLTERVLLLEAAMPTAVTTSLLAIEFEASPQLVSSIVLVTTVLSFVTISMLLSWYS